MWEPFFSSAPECFLSMTAPPCICHLIYFILPNSSLFDIVYKMFTDFENNLALSGLNSDSIGDIIIISKIFNDTRIKGGEIDA